MGSLIDTDFDELFGPPDMTFNGMPQPDPRDAEIQMLRLEIERLKAEIEAMQNEVTSALLGLCSSPPHWRMAI